MTLYTILIVDDEAFIVDWLSNLLETNREFSLNIYRAYSPLKAMEIIEKTRIDLLISDIQMPNCSGFDLAEKLHTLWPNSKTILLTAYSDFAYAHQTIKVGIFSYVLKTSPDTEILEETRKALAQIDKERNQLSLINHLECDLKNFQTQFNRQLFFLWMKGYYYTPSDLKEVLLTLGFDTSDNTNLILVAGLPALPAEPDRKQIDNIIKPFQLQRITSHYLKPYITHSVFEIDGQALLGIIQLSSSITQYTTRINGALELAQTACLETLGSKISYLFGPMSTAVEIPSHYSHAQNLLSRLNEEDSYIFYFGKHAKTILSIDDNNLSTDAAFFMKPAFFNTMKKNLEIGAHDEFMQALKSVCNYLSTNVNWHENTCLQIYYSLVLVFITYINQRDLSIEIAFYAGTGILFRPWLMDSWNAVEDHLFTLADALIKIQEPSHRRMRSNIIQTIQEYVKDHITEDIALQDLSDATGYSSTYLSRYYSEATGTTISQYISSQKMKKIDKLMQNSEMNISDIANSVGFSSRTYFNNYIKRITGMSPQKYRESLTKQ